MMTKRIIVVMMMVVLCAGAALAEAPYQVAWTAQIGTPGMDLGYSVAVDASGNAYISGITQGNIGGTNAGNFDAFLTKFDAAGNEIWSRQIGTPSADRSYSVALDAAGNAYISGDTYGSIDGANAGGTDAFLTKFDAAGNELWSRQIGTVGDDYGLSVAVDASGNAYIGGHTTGSIGGANAGGTDAFLTKFDAAGNEIWSQQIGSSDYDYGLAVAVDASGNAYISGVTGGQLGATVLMGLDAFLTKFDASGNELWTQQMGSSSDDRGVSVAVDAVGNAYMSGFTKGSIGGPNAGNWDAFLTKFDASGNELWSQQIGTPGDDRSAGVSLDAAGNVYIGGYTSGDLGGTSAGERDVFLAKFDGAGNELWRQQIGTSSTDHGLSLTVDVSGNAYISGYTDGSLGGPNAGSVDAFLVKFEVPEPATMSLLAMGACLPLFRRKRRQGLALLRRRSR